MPDMYANSQSKSFPKRNKTDPAVYEALNSFSVAVSIAISVLVKQLGYSPLRAADSILQAITEYDYKLDDDKVFATMQRCGVSFDDATKVETVVLIFRETMNKLNLSPMDAITYLTSKLKIENLLQNIQEKLKFQEPETATSSHLTGYIQLLPTFTATETNVPISHSSHRLPPMKSMKPKGTTKVTSSANVAPPKNIQIQEVSTNGAHDEAVEVSTEDVDAKIAAKALTLSDQTAVNVDQTCQKVKAPSPAVSSVRTKRINTREGNDSIQAPPVKRPRTESV